jgi:ubiquitin C-terminal hydrolase
MFGLANNKGSCWVNATVQAIFRIPEVQRRYDTLSCAKDSPVDMALQKLWITEGTNGLQDLYASIKSTDLPAGESIGDSHELLMALCDKLPWLDKLLRFGFGTNIQCNSCDYSNIVKESVLEFPVTPSESCKTLADSIQLSVRPFTDSQWTCETCKKSGCTQQYLLADLPQILVFHRRNLKNQFEYPSVLVLNKHRYTLFAVVCYNGGHWWTIGRDLPPGKAWVTYDDDTVRKHDPTHFPIAGGMRMLFYSRT